MISIIKKNIKLILFILLVGVLSFGSVYAATLFRASDITYTPPSGNSENNVQTALDYLYSKAGSASSFHGRNNSYLFEYIDEDNPSVYVSSSNYTDLNKKIFFVTNGDDKGLCIIRDNKLHCFYAANFEIEKEHLLNVFSDLPLCTLTLDSYGYPYIGKDCPDTRCQISDSSYNEKYGKTVECFVSNDSTAYNVGVTYYGSVVMQDFTDYAYSGTGVETYDVGANGLFGTSPPI